MSDETHGEQAALTLFKLIENEGKFPLISPQKGSYYFALDKLEVSILSVYQVSTDVWLPLLKMSCL